MHRFFYSLCKPALRFKAHREGVAHDIISQMIDACDTNIIDIAITRASEENPDLPAAIAALSVVPDGKMGAIGDGHIIKAIIAFFQTPLGKALLSILMALLLALIGL